MYKHKVRGHFPNTVKGWTAVRLCLQPEHLAVLPHFSGETMDVRHCVHSRQAAWGVALPLR